MRTHYGYDNNDPEDYIEQHSCGTYAGVEYSVSRFKEDITCKKCLKMFDKLEEIHQEEEEFICNQMGEMAEFYKTHKNEQHGKDL